MNSRHTRFFILALAFTAALAGCGGSPARDAKNIVELPIRGIQAGVKGIDKATGNLVSKLFTDRNRASLVREHKETLEHLKKVKKIIKDRKIVTERPDDKLLQDANDRLAAVGRQLDAPRIPSEVGLRMYRQLEDVRQSLDLIRQRHYTPRYMGYIADR